METIESLQDKIKFDQESLDRFLKKTGKSSIMEDIKIYEGLAPLRYVKNLNKDGENPLSDQEEDQKEML